jgi:molybdate transport system regulatory protein
MNMSYRHAWALVDETTREIVAGRVGGDGGGGAELTPFGHELVSRYREIERSVKSATGEELLALMADIGKKRSRGGS